MTDLEAELIRLRQAHRLAVAELRRLRCALALPPSRKEAAAALGIGERTLCRWRKEGLSENATIDEISAWRRERKRKRRNMARQKY